MTPRQPLYVVISGPPGSGKTTLAAGMAQEMRLQLIAKDQIKETLMSVLTAPNVGASRTIGQAAIEVMDAVAVAASGGAVLVGPAPQGGSHLRTSRTR